MNNQDRLVIEILDDGSVKVETDEISGANHMSADQVLDFLARKLGGETSKARKHQGHVHAGEHLHA